MKKIIVVLGIAALMASCGGDSYKSAKVVNSIDSASYSLGYLIGTDLAGSGNVDTLNLNLIFSGLYEGVKGKESKGIDRSKAEQVWTQFLQGQRAVQLKKAEEDLKVNKEKGDKFLEENKTKAGVITTESGLQYTIVKQGEGKLAKAGDKIKAHYTGTLLDGTKFDSSLDRDEPIEFIVGKGNVIKGWDEALQMMPVGSKWKLFIPADLAYGDRAMGNTIPGGSTLVFDVELLDIVK